MGLSIGLHFHFRKKKTSGLGYIRYTAPAMTFAASETKIGCTKKDTAVWATLFIASVGLSVGPRSGKQRFN